MQKGFEAILNEKAIPGDGEDYISALTAGDRDVWAKARKKHFSSGLNRISLHAIERAAFVVVLDKHEVFYDPVCYQFYCLRQREENAKFVSLPPRSAFWQKYSCAGNIFHSFTLFFSLQHASLIESRCILLM